MCRRKSHKQRLDASDLAQESAEARDSMRLLPWIIILVCQKYARYKAFRSCAPRLPAICSSRSLTDVYASITSDPILRASSAASASRMASALFSCLGRGVVMLSCSRWWLSNSDVQLEQSPQASLSLPSKPSRPALRKAARTRYMFAVASTHRISQWPEETFRNGRSRLWVPQPTHSPAWTGRTRS
jgi:hypothetical protein